MASPVVSLTCTFRRSGNKAIGNRQKLQQTKVSLCSGENCAIELMLRLVKVIKAYYFVNLQKLQSEHVPHFIEAIPKDIFLIKKAAYLCGGM